MTEARLTIGPINRATRKRKLARILGEIMENFFAHDYDLIEITGIRLPQQAEEHHPEWEACQE
jgi:hypothetical protein